MAPCKPGYRVGSRVGPAPTTQPAMGTIRRLWHAQVAIPRSLVPALRWRPNKNPADLAISGAVYCQDFRYGTRHLADGSSGSTGTGVHEGNIRTRTAVRFECSPAKDVRQYVVRIGPFQAYGPRRTLHLTLSPQGGFPQSFPTPNSFPGLRAHAIVVPLHLPYFRAPHVTCPCTHPISGLNPLGPLHLPTFRAKSCSVSLHPPIFRAFDSSLTLPPPCFRATIASLPCTYLVSGHCDYEYPCTYLLSGLFGRA